MKVSVYIWKEKEGDREQISRILGATLDIEEYDLYEIQDRAPHHHRDTETVICFGIRAYNIVSSDNKSAIYLPELIKLIDVPSNRDFRIKAWDILQGLKNKKVEKEEDTKLEIRPEDIAHNLTDKYSKLQKHIQEDGTEHWIGETLLGKTVLITPNSINNTVKTDFVITFEELYAAKLAIEILGLKTLTLVKGKKDDKDKRSGK